MKDTMNSPGCERASDLMAFLYHEMDERETRDFHLHLQQCGQCREEVASFSVMRESIVAWRDEALAGFVAAPPVTTKANKSALGALRQFFALSPLWLKGATAFATVMFVLLAGFAFVKLNTNKTPVNSAAANSGAKYNDQDVERIVKEALAKQQPATKPAENAVAVQQSKPPQKAKTAAPSQLAKNRRPLSRAERDQLAADLRLLSAREDSPVVLLGDRINQ